MSDVGNTCDVCRFWKHTEADRGECHRRSPPAANQAALFSGDAVTAIARILMAHHGVELADTELPENAHETKHLAAFPVTYGEDWCGEFERKH
jgi:hypothetical protein